VPADQLDDHVLQRFRQSRLGLLGLLYALPAIVIGLVGAAQGLFDEPGFLVFFGFFLVLAVFFAGGGIRTAVMQTTLTDQRLLVPRFMHSQQEIGLTEIAGVGLRYVAANRGSGWKLLVWRGDGPGVRLPVKQINYSAPPGQRPLLRQQVPALDWNWLNDSDAARAATAIYRQVLAVQGPAGLLATRDRQASADRRGGYETAFWSPDGRIGALPGFGRTEAS
jgi:hypothetical protein